MWALVWEIFYMGCTVFMASYGLHLLAYKRGVLDPNDPTEPDEYGLNMDMGLDSDGSKSGNHGLGTSDWNDLGLDDDNYDDKDVPKSDNPILKKWLDFGGGFYGIVAFVKLIFIELKQIRDFIVNWQGIDAFTNGQPIDLGFLIGLFVSFFVEQIQNFVAAIIWPTDYLPHYTIVECAVFVVIMYGLYALARKFAIDSLNTDNKDAQSPIN